MMVEHSYIVQMFTTDADKQRTMKTDYKSLTLCFSDYKIGGGLLSNKWPTFGLAQGRRLLICA